MADKDTLEELKKLPPQERVRKLKELEEQRKKELIEAEKLLKSSMDELDRQRKQQVQQIEEEQRNTETAEKARKRHAEEESSQEESGLEATVKREKPKVSEELLEQQRQYDLSLKQLTSNRMQSNLQRWAAEAERGTLSPEYEEVISGLYQQVKDGYSAMKDQQSDAARMYESSEEMLDRLIAAREALKTIGYKTNWFRRH